MLLWWVAREGWLGWGWLPLGGLGALSWLPVALADPGPPFNKLGSSKGGGDIAA